MNIAIPGRNSRLHEVLCRTLSLPILHKGRKLVYQGRSDALFLLRAWDIPRMVEGGIVDVGFCGFDAIIEHQCNVTILQKYYEGYNSIALCTRPPCHTATGTQFRVATEYTNIANRYLRSRFSNLVQLKVSGAAEAYAFFNSIDGVVDLVESGETLAENGLIVEEILLQNSFCLIANRKVASSIHEQGLPDKIVGLLGL